MNLAAFLGDMPYVALFGLLPVSLWTLWRGRRIEAVLQLLAIAALFVVQVYCRP